MPQNEIVEQTQETHSKAPKAPKEFLRYSDTYMKWLLLQSKNHKQFILDFLNAIFEDTPSPFFKGKIVDVTRIDREHDSGNKEGKSTRLDICVKTSTGQLVDVEIFSGKEPALDARTIFYYGQLITTQVSKGENYGNLSPVMVINILAENHFGNST